LLGDIAEGEEMSIKIRYSHHGSKAQVFKTDKGYRLKFREPQRAVTPGQAAVFYRNKQLVGGGWITL
jgi:tRNA-specific 2-thiouridylase